MRETILELLKRKQWKQDDLAVFLGRDPSTISKMGTGSGWEDHWQAFIKILPLLFEVDLLGESDLQMRATNDTRTNSPHGSETKTGKAKAGQRRQ